MIDLNGVLVSEGLNPDTTLVMRHRPTEPALREALPWLAAERPDVYNAYQCAHGPRVESSLARSSHLVSCIGHKPSEALFVGVFEVAGSKSITPAAFHAIPFNKELALLGTRGPEDREHILWFDLRQTDHLTEWKGRLVIQWTPPERAWWRQAARNELRVRAIHEESVLIPSMPQWNQLVLDWAQLTNLPETWRVALSQWRGVYVIVDGASGKSYVGSAYGADNILGRWMDYASTGHGGNKQLRTLDPSSFRFAVLQVVAPDMPANEVIFIEGTWKDRLGTREHGLNDN